uniref:Thioredoxin H-type-like n=1 Tax=Populus alba TaxID=43335 RepID=A0A4U5QQS1_POPAL|nr:thioredoxin H-type-like [Populus alba]
MGLCLDKHKRDADNDELHVEFAGGNVHLITTKESWDQKLSEASRDGKIVLANFSATWCGPCRQIAPFYNELSEKYPSLLFLLVDVDELSDLSSSWEIKATPTFFFLRDGKQLEKLVGANKPELQKKITAIHRRDADDFTWDFTNESWDRKLSEEKVGMERLQLPEPNDTALARSYNAKLRSLNSPQFQANVPLIVYRHLFYTNPCPTCLNGTKLTASLNNFTFVMPQIGLLQAHYFNIKGVFRLDFPDNPPTPFNYTGAPLTANLGTTLGTRVSKIAYNSPNW